MFGGTTSRVREALFGTRVNALLCQQKMFGVAIYLQAASKHSFMLQKSRIHALYFQKDRRLSVCIYYKQIGALLATLKFALVFDSFRDMTTFLSSRTSYCHHRPLPLPGYASDYDVLRSCPAK